jgi:hypothetical protein
MSEFRKATKLSEVAAAVEVQPLAPGDIRYEDLSAGRGGSDELVLLHECLKNYDAHAGRFAKIAFTGHRGTGKTTELYRLERDVSDRFTPVHLTAIETEAQVGDYDYTDLFIWLVGELVKAFKDMGAPLDRRHVEDVAKWFAQVTRIDTEKIESELAIESEFGAGFKPGVFGLALGIFAKLRSMVKGSTESRTEIRRELQNNAPELINRVNLLLDDAHKVLAKHKKPANLLIVVDNLDRLAPTVSGPLFFKNGDFLKMPQAHMIYTVPVAVNLPPGMNIDTIFERKFPLETVKVHDEKDRPSKKGLDALVEAVGQRIEIDTVFAKRAVVRELAKMSGGSLRDLMRLIGEAQLFAAAERKSRIDAVSVRRAVHKTRLSFERLLIPSRDFYPLLAQVHLTKSDPPGCSRDFFAQLLFSTAVFAYNGDQAWYDVHPVILEIKAFQKALSDAQASAQAKPEAESRGSGG